MELVSDTLIKHPHTLFGNRHLRSAIPQCIRAPRAAIPGEHMREGAGVGAFACNARRPMAIRFAGRDKLPACVVRMPSVLRFMISERTVSAYLGSTNW